MLSAQVFGRPQSGETRQTGNMLVIGMGAIMVLLQAAGAPFGTTSDVTAIGLLAGVLGWLMWRVEKRLDEIRTSHEQAKTSIDKLVRAILILSISRDDDDRGAVHAEATRLLKDLGKDTE